MKTSVFIDLHGVLVNSKKMINNYKQLLISLYNDSGVSKKLAYEFHVNGLKQFSNKINEVKEKKLIGEAFLEFMKQADEEWDDLMSSYLPERSSITSIESRDIEYQAGAISNCLYHDGAVFLKSILSQQGKYNVFICSNAHTAHIRGILQGANLLTHFTESQLIGWDKTQSLKNNIAYFEVLQQLQTNINILIGNSDTEMIYAKKHGFSTILVTREYKETLTREMDTYKPDLVIPNLENILEYIKDFNIN